MREILYKAKTTKKPSGCAFDNEWVEGNLIKSGGKYFIHPICNRVSVKNELGKIIIMHEVQPDTICQYTGRVDKNGQNIWENDILVAHLDEKFPEDATYEKVIWHDCGFHTKDKYSDEIEPFDDFTTQYFAVCGNIFDNAELLERKE